MTDPHDTEPAHRWVPLMLRDGEVLNLRVVAGSDIVAHYSASWRHDRLLVEADGWPDGHHVSARGLFSSPEHRIVLETGDHEAFRTEDLFHLIELLQAAWDAG